MEYTCGPWKLRGGRRRDLFVAEGRRKGATHEICLWPDNADREIPLWPQNPVLREKRPERTTLATVTQKRFLLTCPRTFTAACWLRRSEPRGSRATWSPAPSLPLREPRPCRVPQPPGRRASERALAERTQFKLMLFQPASLLEAVIFISAER
jgi:hypothetical protein